MIMISILDMSLKKKITATSPRGQWVKDGLATYIMVQSLIKHDAEQDDLIIFGYSTYMVNKL